VGKIDMTSIDLAELLKLPASERAELAITLWESLIDEQRDAELELGAEDRAELERRWADHLAAPETAIPWADLRRKLRGGRA
jgi:putative addiction module component (TIGR02574 family)